MLSSKGTFQVPKYQRNYAWDDGQVASFLKDLDLCYAARRSDGRRHHFFGGVVTASAPVLGSTRQNNELIDGQQRLATFLMLLVLLKQKMLQLAADAGASDDNELAEFLNAKGQILTDRFESFRDTINLRVVPVSRLQLSVPDQPYFDALLRGENPVPGRVSHNLLSSAFETIGQHLQSILDQLPDAASKASSLEKIMQVVEQDWTVIHMAATERDDAYMLFQVLNDRGRSLTEGELLRASTLEALDSVAPASLMQQVEESWDHILDGRNIDVRKGLHWAYASQIGDWPGRSTLLTDLTDNLFPSLAMGAPLTRIQADEVVNSVSSLERDFSVLSDMLSGEWPVKEHPSVSVWDKDRLRLLVSHLGQVDCLPLLAAASLLEPKKFSEVSQTLERFCFRYSVMVDAPALEAIAIYNRHAVDIRRSTDTYRSSALSTDLRDLLELYAPDEVFRARLDTFDYPRSKSKKPLKYFLMTLEHYVRWFDEGAQGRPNCRDRMRVLDFDNATIEHIYPEHAANPDSSLEPLVDTLGNLTILSPEENDAAGDKSFNEKKRYLLDSNSTLNNQIAVEDAWTPQALRKRQDRLLDMGLAIFTI